MLNPDVGLDDFKFDEFVPLTCDYCQSIYHTLKKRLHLQYVRSGSPTYCSSSCRYAARKSGTLKLCKNCNTPIYVQKKIVKANNFCNLSCAAIHSNANKTHGTRRSKLETWIESQLTSYYPELEFHFNRKDRIKSELDIFIPSLKLAFELNGIFHYEAIYSNEQFDRIQTNDSRKFQACIENGIELCIIDTSGQKYFKESTSLKYLNIIQSIIDMKLL